MDFFRNMDSKVEPSRLNYFAIYNELDSNNTDDIHEADEMDQLLVFIEEGDTSNNDKLRKIGILQGLTEFVTNFTQSKDDELKHIELDDSIIVITSVEKGFKLVLSIKLMKILDEDELEYNKEFISNPEFIESCLIQGYNEFRLHNDQLITLLQNFTIDEFKNLLENWWRYWLKMNFQYGVNQEKFDNFEIKEDGFIKILEVKKKLIKHSNLKLINSIELNKSIQNLSKTFTFKHLLMINDDLFKISRFGLLYESNDNLDKEYKLSLIQWLKSNLYYDIPKDSLILSNIPKLNLGKDDTLPNDNINTNNDVVYDPFKTFVQTIGNVSYQTGITTGIETGVNTIGYGLSYLNGFWNKSSAQTPIQSQSSPSPSDERDDEYEFLIGADNDKISYKNVYLKFEGEDVKLHKLIIFKYKDIEIVLIYDFGMNSINELKYYDDIGESLLKIVKSLEFTHDGDKDETKEESFFYIKYDENSYETNYPMIYNKDEEDKIEERITLLNSKNQSILIQRELFNDIFMENQIEKLIRIQKGWIIYRLIHNNINIIIIKQDEKRKNIGWDTLGKDVKNWIGKYIDVND